ncbi:MAG: hypothetical protein ABL918_12190 [Chakrabartia sp.]
MDIRINAAPLLPAALFTVCFASPLFAQTYEQTAIEQSTTISKPVSKEVVIKPLPYDMENITELPDSDDPPGLPALVSPLKPKRKCFTRIGENGEKIVRCHTRLLKEARYAPWQAQIFSFKPY